MKNKKWSSKENNILIRNYHKKSAIDIAVLLGRSLKSVQSRVTQLGITKKWSNNEIEILYKFYPAEGSLVVQKLPNRTITGIHLKARILRIKNCNKKSLQKQIIKDLGSNKILAECQHHGITVHYHYKHNKRSKCVRCHRRWLKKYRKSLLGNYKSRIQSSLKSYARHQISFSKHLPYNANDLCIHLERIRHKQKNKCPMCSVSYSVNSCDIDHIIPLSSARTICEIKKLYDLDNLTLLCFRCNRFVKRNNLCNSNGVI